MQWVGTGGCVWVIRVPGCMEKGGAWMQQLSSGQRLESKVQIEVG